MAKGGMSRHRSAGNGRAGLRDTPAEIRRTLEIYVRNSSLLAGLPLAERALREQQISTLKATMAKRSAATKAGHEVRRQRETARLVDLLTDPDDPRTIDEIWETLNDRECDLVLEWCRREEEREARERGAK